MTTITTTPSNDSDVRLPRPRIQPKQLTIAGGIAITLAVALAAVTSGWDRFAHAYLMAMCFALSISLGALFFVILQHLTGARWSVSIRRVAELMSTSIPWLGLLFAPILAAMLFGNSSLYEWNDATIRSTDTLIIHKAPYLNAPFFVLRCLLYFTIWTGISRFFLRNSLRQDNGDGRATQQMKRWSGPAMMAFALSLNFAAFDLLMSLDPHWFSTIYGVYFFGGCVVACLAALPLAVSLIQSTGILRQEVTVEHYHDLGKLLFGFVFFWGYIAFSQYLLIWYASIPEETVWYAARQANGWEWISLTLLFGHFFVPFIGLMSRSVRRNPKALVGWSVFLLAMHFVDLYYLIMPSVAPESPWPGLVDALCLLGVSLIWLAVTIRAFTAHRLLCVGDPFLGDSLAFHNI